MRLYILLIRKKSFGRYKNGTIEMDVDSENYVPFEILL